MSETKLDQFDSVNSNGFKFIFAIRERARRKSGGVGVLIKNDLWPYIKVLDDKNENCLWFELNVNTNCKKIIIGAVYLPLEGSPYSSIELFDKLEYDILNFTSESESHLCLLGDFNARSGTLSDFTDMDENIADSLLSYESQLILSKNNLQDLDFLLIVIQMTNKPIILHSVS